MSGKGSRAKAALKRLNQKKTRKAATQATYEGYVKSGNNRKSKRAQRQGQKGLVKNERHAVSYCGNLGCARCFPKFADPLLAKRDSVLWGRGQYMRWLSGRYTKGEINILNTKCEMKQ